MTVSSITLVYMVHGILTCSLVACTTFLQATIRDNTATAYSLKINDLPWSKNTKYTATIQRVGDDSGLDTYKVISGTGTSLCRTTLICTPPEYSKCELTVKIDATIPFPANAQDLITIQAA
ncbi:hypothetical protein N7540_000128 [Penicillium herquei]|nr:hypothetical protein N7540_000128 [Penicillium herquei]